MVFTWLANGTPGRPPPSLGIFSDAKRRPVYSGRSETGR